MWCVLPEAIKDSWIQAGKTINLYDKLAKNITNKVSTTFITCILCKYVND